MAEEKMNIEVVKESFLAAKPDGDVIVIKDLMRGYDELARLYDMMGSLFSFVARDMRGRLSALDKHRADSKLAEHYDTVQSILTYEAEKGIKRKAPFGGLSGSRALHEMHFDIEFFIAMFKGLATSTDDSKCSDLSREAFDQTLSHNVNFAVRQAAKLAMRWLPTRKDFIDSYIKQDTPECLKLIGPTNAALQAVYDVMQGEFTNRDIK